MDPKHKMWNGVWGGGCILSSPRVRATRLSSHVFGTFVESWTLNCGNVLSSTGKFRLAGWGIRDRKRQKGGARCNSDMCFVALDVSETYQFQTHRAVEHYSRHRHCNVSDKCFCTGSIRWVIYSRYPHSLNTFQVAVYQNYTVGDVQGKHLFPHHCVQISQYTRTSFYSN